MTCYLLPALFGFIFVRSISCTTSISTTAAINPSSTINYGSIFNYIVLEVNATTCAPATVFEIPMTSTFSPAETTTKYGFTTIFEASPIAGDVPNLETAIKLTTTPGTTTNFEASPITGELPNLKKAIEETTTPLESIINFQVPPVAADVPNMKTAIEQSSTPFETTTSFEAPPKTGDVPIFKTATEEPNGLKEEVFNIAGTTKKLESTTIFEGPVMIATLPNFKDHTDDDETPGDTDDSKGDYPNDRLNLVMSRTTKNIPSPEKLIIFGEKEATEPYLYELIKCWVYRICDELN